MENFIKDINKESQMALEDINFFKSKGDFVTANILEDAYVTWLKNKVEFCSKIQKM